MFTDANGSEIEPGDEILYMAGDSHDQRTWRIVSVTATRYGAIPELSIDRALFIRLPDGNEAWLRQRDAERALAFASGTRPHDSEVYFDRLAELAYS